MREDQLIKDMAKALEYYRKLWVDHPTSYALESLKKDHGKVASEALDMWEIFYDGGKDETRA